MPAICPRDVVLQKAIETGKIDRHVQKLRDRTVFDYWHADEIDGPVRHHPFEEIADIGLLGRNDGFVAVRRVPRQRRAERLARVDELLAIQSAQDEIDAGKVLHAQRALVKASIIVSIHRAGSGQRFQCYDLGLQIAIDVERKIAGVGLQLLVDPQAMRCALLA